MGEASRRAIERLILDYAEHLDRGDLDGVAELLAHACVALGDGPPQAEGRDAVRELYRRSVRIHADGTPRTQHVTTNLLIEVDEEAGTAHARGYFTVLQGLVDFPLQIVVAGRYRDRFARAGSTWRFAERRIFLDHVGDVSRHLHAGAPGS